MAEHQPVLSPDCRDQNHQKCDGVGWDEATDDFGVCQCNHHLRDKREKAHQAVKEFDLNPCSLTARAAINALQAFDNRLNQVNLEDMLPPKLQEALKISADEAMPCRCGAMLQDTSIICPRHPGVRVKTTEEKAQFARDFDARLEASKR